jgi:L-threonylcarbamoyladenylate synthase
MIKQISEAKDIAISLLNEGQVIAVPTDTVYGLVCKLSSANGIKKIFELKKRPEGLALPVLVGSFQQAQELTKNFSDASELIKAYWPGALTIIFLRNDKYKDIDLGGDAKTIGLRLPNHEFVRQLCDSCGPLASTSANFHSTIPFETAQDIRGAFSESLLPLVVDAGPLSQTASTVVDITSGVLKILRQGPVKLDL